MSVQLIKIVKDGVTVLEAPIIVYDAVAAEEFVKEMMAQLIPALGSMGVTGLLSAITMAKGEKPLADEIGVALTWNTQVPEPPAQPRPGPDIRPQMPADWSPSNN